MLIRILVYMIISSLNGKLLEKQAVLILPKEFICAIGAAKKNKKVKTIKEDKNGEYPFS